MLTNLINYMLTFQGVSIICVAIVLWALISALTFDKHFKPLIADFENHLRELLKTEDKQHFAEFFSEQDEIFRASPLLKHSWQEFTEILIFPVTDRDEIKILNATQPDNFFNRQSLLEPRINLRFYNALPNLLTGGGILGTFVG